MSPPPRRRRPRPRARPLVNVFQPALGAAELAAVSRVFRSNWIGRGAVTELFERDFAAYLGVARESVRSVTCCTEGLFQALAVLDVGPGDDVVLPTISFVGAANAVAATGARPVFCDVDGRTLNATAATIEAALTSKTRAVLLLHYGGVPAPLDAIVPLLERRGVRLVEDSAASVASRLQGRPCGTFGDIGVWSFDAMKPISTGDGGMVYCRDPALGRRLGQALYLGLDTESGLSSSRARWWEFDVVALGRRAIMNDVASAIGRVQLSRLGRFIEARRRVHERYDRGLAELQWLSPPPPLPKGARSTCSFYWIQTRPELRDRLAVHLRRRGVYTTFRYHPLHKVRLYGFRGSLPAAEQAAERTLLLPLHQSLSEREVGQVLSAVHEFGDRL